MIFYDDPSPKPLATRTARAGQQYVEGRRGACLETLTSLGLGWKLLIFDDPSPKLLATRTARYGARAGQQYVEGRRGACLEALSINSLSSDSMAPSPNC